MSQLQKKIERIQRPEGARLGFGPVSREKARAMLLGAVASSAAEAKAALAAGADLVVIPADAATAGALVKDSVGEGACIGALVSAFDAAAATSLKEAGCDFVVAPAGATAAAAVDPEAMGHVVEVTLGEPEAFLRGLAPMNLDALFVGDVGAGLTLAQQADLVRTASMAGTPLIVALTGKPGEADLRVLRDSGVGVVLAPAGADLAALDTALRAVPAPRAARRSGGRELAIVPSVPSGHDDHDHEDDD